MKILRVAGAATVVVGALGAMGLFGAGVRAQQPAAPPQPMSFFITSVGKGDGANLGGLAGADAYCQTLGDRRRTRRASRGTRT